MSKHGTTEKVADILKENLKEKDIQIFNLRKNGNININEYDNIIIGSSIHAGKNQTKIRQFCNNNKSLLLNKKIGLFICCMETNEKALEQLENAYPKELRDHSVGNYLIDHTL